MKSAIAHVLLVLPISVAGCTDAREQSDQSQPLVPEQPSSVWADSEDGVLSLRLGAPDTTVDSEDPITAVVELRNNSDGPVSVLRPFGDWYEAVAAGIELTGPDGPLRYTGPELEYELGHDAFATLEPGQSIHDWLDLTVDNFDGSDSSGQYTIRYRYAVTKSHRETADRIGLKDLSTGEIIGRAITVMKEELSAGNKIEDVVSVQFPKNDYVFSLEEVAKGVRFEYRIVV